MTLHAQIDRLDNVTDEGTKQLIVFIFFFVTYTERRHFAIAAGVTHYILSIHLCVGLFYFGVTIQTKKKKKNREEKEAAAAAPSKNNSLT